MNELHIKACDPDNPYGAVIAGFLAQEFPANLDNKGQLIDALTAAFVASGQIRQGPAPTAEVLVTIRSVIKKWTERNEPIKVLVPWGSRKPDGSGPDVAELGALKQLTSLNERVKRIYSPGTYINIGIEDMGGEFLWANQPNLVADSRKYVTDFVTLVHVLGHEWLDPVKESDLGSRTDFNNIATQMEYWIGGFLLGQSTGNTKWMESNLAKMRLVGWSGDVPQEQVDYYLRQYERYYPAMNKNEHREMLARYLSQSFARYATKTKVKFPEWDTDYIQINFPQPVPGIPDNLAARRLFYRTLPMRFARTHIPAWRAKGYLLIGGNGEVTPKITTVHDIPAEVQALKVELTNGRDTVNINADFVVEG